MRYTLAETRYRRAAELMTSLSQIHLKTFANVLVLAAVLLGSPAYSEPSALLNKLGTQPNKTIIDELSTQPVENLQKELFKKSLSNDVMRAFLESFGAEVPNEQDRFGKPKRSQEENETFDWLKQMEPLPDSPEKKEAQRKIVLLRALATSRKHNAAKAILKFAFMDQGRVYRDECGRVLRAISPYSIPALYETAHRYKKSNARAYAQYQLERLDRESTENALAALRFDEQLTLQLIRSWGVHRARTPVYALVHALNDQSPQIRKAAREVFRSYIAGPPPPAAPKRKLSLPGGKETEEKEPLWLDARQVAGVELRRKYEAETGEKSTGSATKVFKQLLDYYDAKNNSRIESMLTFAEKSLSQKEFAKAANLYDELLLNAAANVPKDKAAKAYLERAKELEAQKKWSEASAYFQKALSTDPQLASQNNVRASAFNAMGHTIQAQGGDPSGAFAQARRLAPAVAKATNSGSQTDKPLFLYGGILAGVLGLLMLVIGFVKRSS